MGLVIESLVNRFMKNSGIEDMVDNPKDYELKIKFDDNGVTLRIQKDED